MFNKTLLEILEASRQDVDKRTFNYANDKFNEIANDFKSHGNVIKFRNDVAKLNKLENNFKVARQRILNRAINAV